MLNPWSFGLLCMAIVALAASWQIPRARLWIAAGAISFIVSSLWWDYGNREVHPLLTFSCDSLVCLLVYLFFQEDWELGFFLAFLASTFSSLLQILGLIHQEWVYASLLEFCNACALLWITTTGIVDMVGKNENSALHPLRARLHFTRHSVS